MGKDKKKLSKVDMKLQLNKNKNKINQPNQQLKSNKVVAQTTLNNKNNKLSALQQKMQSKLAGAKFRQLNELLYTSESTYALKTFQTTPKLFEDYHIGFREQVQKWPQNPVHLFINFIKKLPKGAQVADMGCGDAELARNAPKNIQVYSFDLVAANELVTACDIANTPLKDNTVDIVIFSLSLMGVNYQDFILEADRILKLGGTIKIAEVISRFENLDNFHTFMQKLGYKLTFKDDSNKMFVLLDYSKETNNRLDKVNKKTLIAPKLKPCIYKRR